jgi:hypothetical protein|tara:strand:- start:440 stop:715 length:276 start_codon:yes stop_codon:yes gene_type:complete
MKKFNRKHFEFLINRYSEGKSKIQGDHPEDVRIAIDTFFKAGKMIVDHPEIEMIPAEYISSLISTLSKYPRYAILVKELMIILGMEVGAKS